MTRYKRFLGVDCRRMPPTLRHRPAVWECMLGTVYAMRETDEGGYEVRYFDYDWNSALAWAGVQDEHGETIEAVDPRVAKVTRRSNWTGRDDGPRKGKVVLWILKRDSKGNKR